MYSLAMSLPRQALLSSTFAVRLFGRLGASLLQTGLRRIGRLGSLAIEQMDDRRSYGCLVAVPGRVGIGRRPGASQSGRRTQPDEPGSGPRQGS